MEDVRQLQQLLGAAWTSVKFYFSKSAVPDIKLGTDLRFCEAVLKARSSPLLLHPQAVSCPGANYVFGWGRNFRDDIVADLIERRGVEADTAERLISEVPVLKQPPEAIGLNTGDIPDVIISYCQPPTAMDFLNLWQTGFGGRSLVSSLSSILSVCGNVSVGSYLSKDVSLSFGCVDAREFAGMGRDRLIIGIPYPLIKKLAPRSMAPHQRVCG